MTRLSDRGGFSLTELLMSIIIISVGVVGFASAVGLASTELRIGRRDTELASAVAEKLEELKATPDSALASGSETVGDFALDWVVQGTDPKKAVLQVTYLSHTGSTQVDTFVAYIPKKE